MMSSRIRSLNFLGVLISVSFLCGCWEESNNQDIPTEIILGPDWTEFRSTGASSSKVVQDYVTEIREAGRNLRPLKLNVSGDLERAQEIALTSAEARKLVHETEGKGAFLRAEVFSIKPIEGEIETKLPYHDACSKGQCFRIELYSFPKNKTLRIVVDLKQDTIVSVSSHLNIQPEITSRLKEVAIDLARNSAEVAEALKRVPHPSEAVMAGTKTALNDSRCERSLHLCVAPTFVFEDKALWTIVDLTDLRVVGVRWTALGDTANLQKVTERRLRYDKVMDESCRRSRHVDNGSWSFDYTLTGSDGLELSNVYYNGKHIIKSAKLVDWHVSYSGPDGFGYSDAVGCPEFSHAAVGAVTPPRLYEREEKASRVLVIEQSFQSEQWPRPCNYNYLQRFELGDEGSFRFAVGSLGRGCGNDGVYRPVLRLALPEITRITEWSGDLWNTIEHETWRLQNETTSYTREGYHYRFELKAGGALLIEPGQGQFEDGGRGDRAFTYFTRGTTSPLEGADDMLTIGPCCNEDFRQGPERFINTPPEEIVDTEVTFWYVPQMHNDDSEGKEYCWAKVVLQDGVYRPHAFPCISGPRIMFRE